MFSYPHIFALLFLTTGLLANPLERTFVVETKVVQPENFIVQRRYIGTINAENFSILRAKSAGTIASIAVKPEQNVKKGQLLASQDNRSQKSSLEIALKTHRSLQSKVDRLKKLKNTGDVTKGQVDEAKRDLLNASLNLENAKKALEDTEIRAPFDGIAGVPRVVIGESVKPDTAIISVRQGAYSLIFRVPPKRIRELAVGQEVTTDNGKSTIAAIERTIDPLNLTGFAKTNFPACKNCIIGESIFCQVAVAHNPKAILVNHSSLYYDKGNPYVVRVVSNEKKETRAQPTIVRLGQEQNGLVEIVSGLSPGDSIVIADPKRITPNALLKVLK